MTAPASRRPPLLAAVASAGAGLVHIAAAGADHNRAAVALLLAALGAAQLAWGAWAGTRTPGRVGTVVGASIAGIALVGWLVAVASGLPWPAALADPLSPAVPDAVAAGLSLVVLASLGRRALAADVDGDAVAGDAVGPGTWVGLAVVGLLSLGAVVAVPAATEDRQLDAARAEQGSVEPVAAGATTTSGPAARTSIGAFDPEVPLDLSDVVGATPAEQEGAEGLVADVLAASARFPTAADAEAAGYVSIGDEFTGEEHLIDWSAVLDPATLDPERPEALVYDVADDGTRTLAAAMFVLPPGTPLDAAPRPGGELTTWHLHGELCIDPDREPPAAVGSTDATGECPPGLEEASPSPTLHVWVTRHPCGPFSELEGVGTDPSAVAAGCEHRHG